MTLRTRLSLLSAASMLVVFALVGVLLYGLFARSANRALDAELQRQHASLARGELLGDVASQGSEPPEGLPPGPPALPLRAARRELLAQVVSPRGVVRVTSDPLQDLGELKVDAVTRSVARTGTARRRDVTVEGTSLRLLETRLRGRLVLQLAIPREDTDSSLALLRRLLVLIALVSGGAAAAVGRWLAGRALAPIDDMIESVRRIEQTADLSRRVAGGELADELGALARTFNEMLASIERLDEAQRRFVADASHELRTPLTSLGGNLEFLARSGVAEQERAAAWSDVHADMRRLSALAGDLLALARADLGTPAAHAPVDVGALASGICDNLARTHGEHAVSCTAAPGTTVPGDEEGLRRVISNLVANALAYTPPGTHVDVSVERRDNAVTIVVADDGPGMSADDAGHAFDRFRRGATSRDSDGAGLGLAIVRRVVEAHDGSVTLDTTPGSGCRFTVTLPTG